MPLGRAARHRRASVASMTVAAAGVLAAVLLPTGPASGVPAINVDERAAAIASPAAVYLEAKATGYLRSKSTGALVDANPVTVTRRCSGFVVGADGYVVTAGHCVQSGRDSLRDTAAHLVADDLLKNHKLETAQRAAFIKDAMTTTDFVDAGGAAPAISVHGQLFGAKGGLTAAPAITGQVVSTQTVAGGDVALVKLAKTGLPVAQLATAPPSADSHVVQIAFRTHDDNVGTGAYAVSSAPASILGPYAGKTPPVFRLDSDLGDAAYGGMVIDGSGHVVGMINADPAKVNRLMTDLATIRQVLDGANVKNEPAANDRDYVAGLDAYFGGRYTEAIKKFDAVLAATPANRVAQNYRDQARVRLSLEDDSGTGGTPWVTIALAAAGGLVAGIGVLATTLRLRRGSRRRRETRDRLAPDPFARDPFAPDPFASDPIGPQPFPAQYAGPFPPTFAAPVSGAPVSAAPVSAAPVSAAPVSAAPVSAAPVSAAPISAAPVSGTPLSFVDDDAYPTVRVPDGQPEPVAQSETANWAGVPVPVSAPPGIPVQHPLWTARAPVRLPELFGQPAEPGNTEPTATESAAGEPAAEQPKGTGMAAQPPVTAGPEPLPPPWPQQQSAWTPPVIPASPWAATPNRAQQPQQPTAPEQPPAPEQPTRPEWPAGAD